MKTMFAFCLVVACAVTASAQEKRNLHVTKVTQSEWSQESSDNGNTSMKRKFIVMGHDAKNDYQGDCEELVVISKDAKKLVHFHCIQVESGEDYTAKFSPGSFSIDCTDCTETDTDKYAAYAIRTSEERNSK